MGWGSRCRALKAASWGAAACLFLSGSAAFATNFIVTSTADTNALGTLRWAIEQVNASGDSADTITFNLPAGQTITLESVLPMLDKSNGSVTIDGSGASGLIIDGDEKFRPFFVNQGTVTISNLTVQNGLAKGGDGGTGLHAGGGGGLGAGGAIFIRSGANVTLDSVNLVDNTAAGGHGGGFDSNNLLGGGGGGGMGGNGGGSNSGGGGGGGGAFSSQNGGDAMVIGGQGGGPNGGAGGSPGGSGGELSGGGGGNFLVTANGGDGGFGGGGGGAGSLGNGGNGNFGGGGGGVGAADSAGDGGFGGGGGAGSGSAGGFGGGHGDVYAGLNVNGSGGGGAGFGGAVFVMEGATLTIRDSDISGGTVEGGLGGNGNTANQGMAAGSGLFLQGTALTYDVTGNNTSTVADTIADAAGNSQAGSVTKTGTGTLVLGGANTYSGGTFLNGGTVGVTNDNNLGTGSLHFDGGTLRTDAGITTDKQIFVNAGGAIFDTNGFDSLITAQDIFVNMGAGFTKTGEGTLTIQNNWGISNGDVFVDEGTLQYLDQFSYYVLPSSFITVNDGATLRGTGFISPVTINSGGILAAGTADDVGTLSIGHLTLNEGAIINMRLGEPGVAGGTHNDYFDIWGNLTLDGTLNIIDNSPSTDFEFGTYRLMQYGGSLTNNGLELGTMPESITDAELQILTDLKQINLVMAGSLFFNGSTTTADGTIHGGDGIWNDSLTNWTNASGTSEKLWNDKVGIFAGSAGTVTVEGEQTFTGLQFSTDGYQIVAGTDGSLSLDGTGKIRVDDGVTATINAPLTGTGSLEKLDPGTLILGGVNTYSGGTTVSGGVLQGTTDSLQGDILNNASVVFDQSSDGTYSDIISGTGSLTKAGTGTVTLTETNTYSGGTFLNGGVLSVTDSTQLGDLSGSLTFDGGTLRYGSNSGMGRSIILEDGGGTIEIIGGVGAPTFLGLISGTGSLTKNGPGGLFLNGNNTYSGGTILNSGILHLWQDANLGDVSGDLTLNAGEIRFRSDNETFARNVILNGDASFRSADASFTNIWSGDISGAGALIKNFGGTLILDGTNTYSGGTTVNGGTVRLGTNGSLAETGDLTINNFSTFDLNGNTQTIATLFGNGFLTLGDGALTTDTDTNSTYSGIISGNGSFTKDGTGTLTLNGTNTYSGGTTVSGGVLQGNTDSLQGDILNNAGVVFEQQTDGSYSGEMSGNGTFTKTGTGQLNLTESNAFGTATVEQGTLVAEKGLLGNVNIQEQGTFEQRASLLGNVSNQGHYTNGDDIAITNIFGAFEQSSTGTLQIGINDGSATPAPGVNNDFFITSQAASLGGTVEVDATGSDFTHGMKFSFLGSATGFGGTEFDSITDNLAFFDAFLGYEQIGGYDYAYFTLRLNDTDFVSHANNFNQQELGGYLDFHYPGASGDLLALYDSLLVMTDDELNTAMTQMIGDGFGTAAQMQIQQQWQILQTLRQQLQQGTSSGNPATVAINNSGDVLTLVKNPETGRQELMIVRGQCTTGCQQWRGWMTGYGIGGNVNSDGNANAANYGLGGTVFGADISTDDLWRSGLFAAYGHMNLRVNGGQQQIESDAMQFGSYLLREDDTFYTLMSTSMGFNNYDSERRVQGQQADADYHGWQANAWLEQGLKISQGKSTWKPFVALQYIYVNQDDFNETGAGILNLSVDETHSHALRGMLGTSWETCYVNSKGRVVTPRLHAMWLHEFLDTETTLNSVFSGVGGPSFATQGVDFGRDWAVLGSSLNWEFTSSLSLFAGYDLQFNNTQTMHIGSGGVQYLW